MKLVKLAGALIGTGVMLCVSAQALAQAQPVVFPRGKTVATLAGMIKGAQSRDYMVRGAAGQMLNVSLSTANPSAYFNVLPQGSEQAIFIGSVSGNDFSAPLPETGPYVIRVYLMRSAARQNQSAAYTLKVSLGTASTSSSGGGGKARISDLAEMNDIRAIDVMAERGFKDVDSFGSGETRYGIFWRSSSRQCVQLTFADGKVVAANDIGTHPKCR
jgi:hypothetical protein